MVSVLESVLRGPYPTLTSVLVLCKPVELLDITLILSLGLFRLKPFKLN